MARLKYMIKNLESPILILHQESALFTMECFLFTIEGLQLFYILSNLAKFKRNYEYNLSLVYKVPIWVTF